MSVAIPTSTNRESTEQVKPLAHAIFVEEEDDLSMEMKNKYHHNRTCLKCCGLISALMLILAMIMLILVLTAFHIKDPILNMNSVTLDNRTTTTSDGHLSFEESFSLKNPNVGSFRYDGVKKVLYYYGDGGGGGNGVLGQATVTYQAGGLVKARRTIPVNITLVVLTKDLGNWGTRGLSSYTEISGKVKILNIIKKHVLVKLNCTMNVDLRNLSVRDQNCKKL